MNKSTQLILGMLLGFEKGHEIYDGAEWDSDMAGELLAAKSITKEDIFSMTPNGKSIFQYKQTWENLKKLFNVASKNGQTITLEDLQKVIVNNKTALALAADCGAVKEIFTPEIWVGHSEEMENLWYSLDKHKRTGIDFLKIKSEVASLEGRTIREHELEKAGIEVTAMHTAIKTGNIDAVREKLAARGDHLRLADAKLCDSDGDHGLYQRSGWDNFDKLLAEWAKHGEAPDADFFLFNRGSRESIIETAFRHNSEKKVFNEKVFEGRPDEMIKLYKQLKEDHRKKINIGEILSNVVENTCGDMVQVDASLTIDSLIDVLYKPSEEMNGWAPVIGLGLKKTWENIDDVDAILKAQGQSITLEHLRLKSGANGESCLAKAARFGHFEKVLSILEENGERLELDDLLAKDAEDHTVLDILIKAEQLGTILRPSMWAGRVTALGEIWDHVPANVQKDVKGDFQSAYTEANLLSLRALRAAPGAPKPGLG